MKKRHDLPQGSEYEMWKKQLPKWISTGVLDIPEEVVKEK